MKKAEIYLSFVLLAVAFVILLISLQPYQSDTPQFVIPKVTPSPIPVSGYECPPSGWVDCMPGGPNLGIRFECTTEAQNWFKLNCPDFKGVAY